MGIVPGPGPGSAGPSGESNGGSASLSNRQLKRRLYRVSLMVLICGLCLGGLIYRFADEVVDTEVQYLVIDGQVHTIAIRDTKRYRHDLERFGGKTALMFDDFYHWLAGLWVGKALGQTLVWMALLLSLGIALFARSFPDDFAPGSVDQDQPGLD